MTLVNKFYVIVIDQEGTKEAEEKTRYWQLPWIPPPTEVPPSEEEIARKAAIREKQGQRLREMAEAKRLSKINEMDSELSSLRFLLKQLDQVEEEDIPTFLSDTGYSSRQELESTISKVTQSLRKARGEPKNEPAESDENTDSLNNEKYPLMNVPDDILTPEQVCFQNSEKSFTHVKVWFNFHGSSFAACSLRTRGGKCFLKQQQRAGYELDKSVMRRNSKKREEIN